MPQLWLHWLCDCADFLTFEDLCLDIHKIDLTSLLTGGRPAGVHLSGLQPSAGQFFASLDPINEASAILNLKPFLQAFRPADGEQDERSPSRSEGEAESESSDSESLDMAPSDTERTEGTERSLHQTTVIKAPVTGALISASSAGSGGSSGGGGGSSFSFSSASSLSSSSTNAGCASSLGGGGASELLPVPQPTASSAPKSPEPPKGALGGV
uniref:Macaca fascicularis brain cDNA clone: QflA-21223, similar to human H2.0-like homeo box 1 (Drosophila) (HLX1), mRNA, RefSeq: NM_021958.2 n=1 Tax=Macaca fascicularis TaxID=9541 RepID=I7G6T7_MACFA|nr:unnamed protein product [Macaca fascicularis]